MRLTVVGCSGSFPGPLAACSSYLVEVEGYRLLLDLGSGSLTGLQRYAELASLDAIVLSHLHVDHCSDAADYAVARRWYLPGPAVPLYGPAGTGARLAAIAGSTEALDTAFVLREVSAGRLELGPFTLDLAVMQHPALCHAVRLTAGGRSLTYSGDTGASEALVTLARETDLALFEATWYSDGTSHPPALHLTARQAGEHAGRAGAGRLLLTHVPPTGDLTRTTEEGAAAYRGGVAVAVPGLVVEV